MILMVTGCTTGQVVHEEKNIQIGAIQALSGETSAWGIRTKEGVDLAVDEVNNKGGINGRKIEIIYEDDSCVQQKSIGAAYKLMNQGIKVIMGPTCSSSVLSVAPITEDAKVLIFVTVGSSDKIKDAGDYVFRNRIVGAHQAATIAEFSYDTLGSRTAATLYIDRDNGITYKNGFRKKFEELGGRVLLEDSYMKGTSDFLLQLSKIKALNPDVLFIAGQASEVAVKKAREIGITSTFVGPNLVETKEMLNIAGTAAEGMYYVYSTFGIDKTDEYNEFQDKFMAKYDKKSDVFSANAYDAAMLVFDSIEKCGEEDSSCMRDYLYSIEDYKGASGSLTFDEFGEVTKPLVIKKVENGEFVVVG